MAFSACSVVMPGPLSLILTTPKFLSKSAFFGRSIQILGCSIFLPYSLLLEKESIELSINSHRASIGVMGVCVKAIRTRGSGVKSKINCCIITFSMLDISQTAFLKHKQAKAELRHQSARTCPLPFFRGIGHRGRRNHTSQGSFVVWQLREE